MKMFRVTRIQPFTTLQIYAEYYQINEGFTTFFRENKNGKYARYFSINNEQVLTVGESK